MLKWKEKKEKIVFGTAACVCVCVSDQQDTCKGMKNDKKWMENINLKKNPNMLRVFKEH